MSTSSKSVVTISARGQVVLPKSIRDRLHWEPGTRLIIEETSNGVLLKPDGVPLKPEALFPPTRYEDVFGMLSIDKSPNTTAK